MLLHSYSIMLSISDKSLTLIKLDRLFKASIALPSCKVLKLMISVKIYTTTTRGKDLVLDLAWWFLFKCRAWLDSRDKNNVGCLAWVVS